MIEKIVKLKQKIKEERDELDKKINKLLVFISATPVSKTDDAVTITLREQVFYMKGYLRMLNTQITLLSQKEKEELLT